VKLGKSSAIEDASIAVAMARSVQGEGRRGATVGGI